MLEGDVVEISAGNEEEQNNIRGERWRMKKLFTLMVVLSLLADDTLHLLAALASAGGDSLSLSAL